MRHKTRAIAAVFGVAAITASLGLFSGTSAEARAGCPPPIAVAHRGESSLAPEETAPAMTAAVKGGAKVVEMDIQWTRSTVAVLMHDSTVNRTTTGRYKGSVRGLWLWQVRSLDAGSKFSPSYAGARVITLGEAFRLIQPAPGVMAIPELKGTLSDAQLRIVAKAIIDNKMAGRVIVQSFSTSSLQRFHKIAPSVPLALTTSQVLPDPVGILRAAGASYWLPYEDSIDPASLALTQAAGIKVWPWTADTPDEWLKLSWLGVDGILTNHPSQYVGWATARCGMAP